MGKLKKQEGSIFMDALVAIILLVTGFFFVLAGFSHLLHVTAKTMEYSIASEKTYSEQTRTLQYDFPQKD